MAAVDALVEHAVALGLSDAALDDLVHDVASHAASAANNEGIAGQVKYLMQRLGRAAALCVVVATLDVAGPRTFSHAARIHVSYVIALPSGRDWLNDQLLRIAAG